MTETQKYNVRGMPVELPGRISRAAGARGMTVAEYLERLVELHDAMGRYYGIDHRIRAILDDLSLAPVTR